MQNVKHRSMRLLTACMAAVMLAVSGTAAGIFPQTEVSAAVSTKVNQDDFDAKLYKALLAQCDTNGYGNAYGGRAGQLYLHRPFGQ